MPRIAVETGVDYLGQAHTILVVEGRKPAVEHLAPLLDDLGHNVVAARTRRETLAKVLRRRQR